MSRVPWWDGFRWPYTSDGIEGRNNTCGGIEEQQGSLWIHKRAQTQQNFSSRRGNGSTSMGCGWSWSISHIPKPNSQLDAQHSHVKLKDLLTAFHCPFLIYQSSQHLSWSYPAEEYFISAPWAPLCAALTEILSLVQLGWVPWKINISGKAPEQHQPQIAVSIREVLVLIG